MSIDLAQYLPIVLPMLVLQYGLAIFGLYDLFQEDRRVKGDSKIVWALVIFFASMVGPIVYFLAGRDESGGIETGGVSKTDAAAVDGVLARWPRLATTDGLAIRTQNLTKQYGRLTALEGLDLEVPTGSIFGFLGPNGAGKTTSLRMLTGLAQPTSGTAEVAGVQIGAGAELARRIGYLDQSPQFYGWMKARELLELVGRTYDLDGRELRMRVGEVLEISGLSEAANRRIAGFSGGMRQRLGIAQALINRPQVLFLDEPVSALDPEGRRDVLQIIERVRGTATVLMSTHILNDIERVCDRVAILNYGRLVAESPIEELLERYAQPVFELEPDATQSRATGRLADALRAQPWVRDVRLDGGTLRVFVHDPNTAGAEILPIAFGTGVSLVRFERARPSLEDVFMLLVAKQDRVSSSASFARRPTFAG